MHLELAVFVVCTFMECAFARAQVQRLVYVQYVLSLSVNFKGNRRF